MRDRHCGLLNKIYRKYACVCVNGDLFLCRTHGPRILAYAQFNTLARVAQHIKLIHLFRQTLAQRHGTAGTGAASASASVYVSARMHELNINIQRHALGAMQLSSSTCTSKLIAIMSAYIFIIIIKFSSGHKFMSYMSYYIHISVSSRASAAQILPQRVFEGGAFSH